MGVFTNFTLIFHKILPSGMYEGKWNSNEYSTTLDPFLCEIAGDNVPALAELFVSVFGFDLKLSDKITSILPLLDIILVKGNG